MTRYPLLVSALVLLLVLPGSGAARPQSSSSPLGSVRERTFVPGEILVRFKPGVAAAARASIVHAEGAAMAEVLPLPGLTRVSLPPRASVAAAAAAFERRPEVLFAEPNFVHEPAADKYVNNTDSTLTMLAPVNLTGRVGCTADYDMRLDTEYFSDFFWIERATTPAGPWQIVNGWTGSTEGTFVPFTEDLSAADGSPNLFLRLRLTSDESVIDDGAYVDNLAVKCLSSTYDATDYESASGTSMAAPHVAGVAALKWAQTPLASVADVKSALLAGVDPKSSLFGQVGSGGRVNACKALAPGCPAATPSTPNDSRFAELWGLHQASDADIDAPEAWARETGDAAVIVAVVDTGVAYDHPDLDGNIWTNAADPPGNGDQDGNGFVDDSRGWDFLDDDNDPRDFDGHGTHVAGTIGAEGNNATGITGVDWDVSLMPLRAGDEFGFASADTTAAFLYACRNGADVVNGSFAGYFPSASELAALRSPECANTLFVFAAGNDASSNDDYPVYPCGYGAPAPEADLPNIVCVAATDREDELAEFSNYGFASVDLAAPGVDVLSTFPAYSAVHGDAFEADLPGRWAAAALPGNKVWGRTAEAAVGGFSVADSPTLAVPQPPAPAPPAPAPPADVIPPRDPLVLSPSHAIGVPTNDSTIDIIWSGASDAQSGVDGFSFVLDNAQFTLPDAVKDAEENSSGATFSGLANGPYYFHLRTRDNAGNWTSAVHYGPMYVAVRRTVSAVCVVPSLKGRTVVAARKALAARKCALGGVRRKYSSKVKRNRIVAQSRRAGARLPRGTKVNVVVSRGARR